MTAFAACLFALAALASGWTLAISYRQFGAGLRTLRAERAALEDGAVVYRESMERPFMALRARPVPCPGSGWPQMAGALAA